MPPFLLDSLFYFEITLNYQKNAVILLNTLTLLIDDLVSAEISYDIHAVNYFLLINILIKNLVISQKLVHLILNISLLTGNLSCFILRIWDSEHLKSK